MNKARTQVAKNLVSSGKFTPKQAYESVKALKHNYAHAVWVGGALVRKDKAVGK